MAIILIIFLLIFAVVTTTVAFYRLRTILARSRRKPLRHGRNNVHEPTHLLIVLGSGGHTAEMLSMLTRAVNCDEPKGKMNWQDFAQRTWVVSEGDSISAVRAQDFEEKAATALAGTAQQGVDAGKWEVAVVPRARRIHQPLYTSPFSSLQCLAACWTVLTKHTSMTRDGHATKPGEIDFPDLILCNGPATATILVFTSLLLRFFDAKGCETRGRMRTIYVESWARVKRPSLSGRLLARVVDRFLVQWPQLDGYAGRAEYRGVLV